MRIVAGLFLFRSSTETLRYYFPCRTGELALPCSSQPICRYPASTRKSYFRRPASRLAALQCSLRDAQPNADLRVQSRLYLLMEFREPNRWTPPATRSKSLAPGRDASRVCLGRGRQSLRGDISKRIVEG